MPPSNSRIPIPNLMKNNYDTFCLNTIQPIQFDFNEICDYIINTMLEINCPNCLSSNILEDRQVDRDIDCISCNATFLVEKVEFEEESDNNKNEVFASDAELNQVIITTGPPPFEYEIIDTIIVLDTLDKNFFHEAEPSLAFDGVKRKLRNRGLKQGANAIINCHFDYRISAGHGIFGVLHDLEIFAYGTLVKKV